MEPLPPRRSCSVEQLGEEVAVRPVLDLVGGMVDEWVDQRGENFAIGVVGGVEEDGPSETVVAADQERGGSVKQAVVPGVDAAARVDVADLPTEAVVDGPCFVRGACEGLTDGVSGENWGMV